MIVDVFCTGISRAEPVRKYLTSAYDSNGIERAVTPVELRGNAWRMSRLIDECHRKWRYTSGVLSFANENHPDDIVQNQIMDEFEEFAFAGKDTSTWDIYWVRHEDKGRVELHFVIPRVDLETGQDLNAFQRGWDSHWRPWQRDICYRFGLVDPHERRKVTASPKAKRETKTRQKLRTGIYKTVENGFKSGAINSRDRLLAVLASAGEVTRQSQRTISVRFPEEPRPIRLEGPIFEQRFNFQTGSCDPEIPRSRSGRSREASPFRRDRDDAFERRRQFFDEHRRKARRNDQKLRAFLERISDIDVGRDRRTGRRDPEALAAETETFERDCEAQRNRLDESGTQLLDDSGSADSIWQDRHGDRDFSGDDPADNASSTIDSLDDREANPDLEIRTSECAGAYLDGTGDAGELQQPDKWGDDHTRERANAADAPTGSAVETRKRQRFEPTAEHGTKQSVLDRIDGDLERPIDRLARRHRSRTRTLGQLNRATRHRAQGATRLYRTALETAHRIASFVKSALAVIRNRLTGGPGL